jgi:hypothetical protein
MVWVETTHICEMGMLTQAAEKQVAVIKIKPRIIFGILPLLAHIDIQNLQTEIDSPFEVWVAIKPNPNPKFLRC